MEATEKKLLQSVAPIRQAVLIAGLVSSCGDATSARGTLGRNQADRRHDTLSEQAVLAGARGDDVRAYQLSQRATDIFPSSLKTNLIFATQAQTLHGISLVSILRRRDEEGSVAGDEALVSAAALLGLGKIAVEAAAERDDRVGDLPVLLPFCAGATRRALPLLSDMARAVELLCPFIDPAVRAPGRGCASSAELHTAVHGFQARLHLAWALAHLVDIFVLHQVLAYKTTPSNQTNLELRMSRLTELPSQPSVGDIADFVAETSRILDVVDRVFDTSGRCDLDGGSVMHALLEDIATVRAMLAQLTLLPEEFKHRLLAALSELTTLDTSAGASEEQLKNLRQQFAGKVSASLGNAITQLDAQLNSSQHAELCRAYVSLGGAQQCRETP